MGLLEEKGPKNWEYAVAYDSPDETIRVAGYSREDGKLKAVLEIQKTGIDLLVEIIEFTNGEPTFRKMSSHSCSQHFDNKTLEAKLAYFASKFKEIFESNVHLKKVLPDYFAAIASHITQ